MLKGVKVTSEAKKVKINFKMGHPQERRDEMQDLLAKEVELNVTNIRKPEWLIFEKVLSEIIFALIPEVHEGKTFSYGAIWVETLNDLELGDIIICKENQLDYARKLADGEEWFILYEKNDFRGLLRFKTPLSNEVQLIRQFPITGGLIITRSANGITKFFQGDSLTIHENRKWFTKPNVKSAAWKVSQCVANIDKVILNRILEFAFHLMSPISRAGAILVWFLKPGIPDIEPASIEVPSVNTLHLSLMNDSHSRMIFHLFAQVDGASLFDHKGNLMKTGVQLKYSEQSRKLIQEFRGTRHTSSMRFSYDWGDAIVVTVSEDGPVTVFSNGANIADLQIYSAHKQARILRTKRPEQSEKITSKSFEIVCMNCNKNSMVEQVQVEGLNESKELECPICGEILYSSICYSLEGRPFKRL